MNRWVCVFAADHSPRAEVRILQTLCQQIKIYIPSGVARHCYSSARIEERCEPKLMRRILSNCSRLVKGIHAFSPDVNGKRSRIQARTAIDRLVCPTPLDQGRPYSLVRPAARNRARRGAKHPHFALAAMANTAGVRQVTCRACPRVLPNPSLNHRTHYGGLSWPGLRYAVHFRSPGQAIPPQRSG
jgi:hypothetical protein